MWKIRSHCWIFPVPVHTNIFNMQSTRWTFICDIVKKWLVAMEEQLTICISQYPEVCSPILACPKAGSPLSYNISQPMRVTANINFLWDLWRQAIAFFLTCGSCCITRQYNTLREKRYLASSAYMSPQMAMSVSMIDREEIVCNRSNPDSMASFALCCCIIGIQTCDLPSRALSYNLKCLPWHSGKSEVWQNVSRETGIPGLWHVNKGWSVS